MLFSVSEKIIEGEDTWGNEVVRFEQIEVLKRSYKMALIQIASSIPHDRRKVQRPHRALSSP